ncbi:MAG: hypothetical protein GYB65_00435 [Chloroflexi bacterium]|nr:hypothetical protein [Chloroflexota bacterium]
MPWTKAETRKLVERIKAAFASCKYPGDDQLVTNTSDEDLESVQIANAFRGKTWEDISLEMLEYHRGDLIFFTPEAFCHYLPAYLIAAITGGKVLGLELRASLVDSLTPPRKPGYALDWFMERAKRFTPAQVGVIQDYFCLMSEKHDIKYLRYWLTR